MENMTHNYGELIPDKIVDIFHEKIIKCINEKRSYEHHIRNLIKINGGKIPIKIKNLVNGMEELKAWVKYNIFNLEKKINYMKEHTPDHRNIKWFEGQLVSYEKILSKINMDSNNE